MKRDHKVRLVVPLTVLLVTAGETAGAQAVDTGITTYRALYDVEYKGRSLGTAEFSVSYDAVREIYRFESTTHAKGLLKLMTPNPVIQRSDFRVDGGTIRPLEFWYEDGSRKGEDNAHVVFDWDRGVALSETEGARHELELTAGVLDRGSAQVALMWDLARTGRPGTYVLADGDSLKTYEYSDNGELSVVTGIGPRQAIGFVQQREGSSPNLWVWVAPDLQFVPVRIERRRDGEVQTAFTLKSMETSSAE
jgi:Protein of unknown function (DUF3108)